MSASTVSANDYTSTFILQWRGPVGILKQVALRGAQRVVEVPILTRFTSLGSPAITVPGVGHGPVNVDAGEGREAGTIRFTTDYNRDTEKDIFVMTFYPADKSKDVERKTFDPDDVNKAAAAAAAENMVLKRMRADDGGAGGGDSKRHDDKDGGGGACVCAASRKASCTRKRLRSSSSGSR